MWQNAAHDYQELIQDPERDSRVLREQGLFPNVLDLVGNCDDAVVLDAGTGTGWLFESINPSEAYACDIAPPQRR